MKKSVLCTVALMSMVLSTAAFAGEYGVGRDTPWQFRARVIDVNPGKGGSATIAGTPNADAAVVPEFDISYFWTKHIATELILGTSKHDVKLQTASGDLDLGSTWMLPPTLTAQYHFTPDNQFSPYVGAGINYMLPYAETKGASVNRLQVDGSFGWALQAGADYWLNDDWGVNMDVKKIFSDVDASINSGSIRGNVELNPWVIGTGISYRL